MSREKESLVASIVTSFKDVWEAFNVNSDQDWAKGVTPRRTVLGISILAVVLLIFLYIHNQAEEMIILWSYNIILLANTIIFIATIQTYIYVRECAFPRLLMKVFSGCYIGVKVLSIIVFSLAIVVTNIINRYLMIRSIKADFLIYATANICISLTIALIGLEFNIWLVTKWLAPIIEGLYVGVDCLAIELFLVLLLFLVEMICVNKMIENLIMCSEKRRVKNFSKLKSVEGEAIFEIEKTSDMEIEFILNDINYNIEYVKYVNKVFMLSCLVIIMLIATFNPTFLGIKIDANEISAQSSVINVVGVFSVIIMFWDKRTQWINNLKQIRENRTV